MPHYILLLLASTPASLLFLFSALRPLGLAFPGREQKFFRPHWFTDLCFLLGQYLLWNTVVFTILASGANYLDFLVPSAFRARVAAQPWWLQVLEVVVLSDFCVYWGHRLQHRLPIL